MKVVMKGYVNGTKGNNIPAIDPESCGKSVAGLFADEEGVVILIVNVQPIKNIWYILNEYVTYDISSLKTIREKLEYFEEKHRVRHFFGNELALQILNKKTNMETKDNYLYWRSYINDNSDDIYSYWETVTLTPEETIYYIKSNLENIYFGAFQETWINEFENISKENIINKKKPYHKLFALTNIIKTVEPEYDLNYHPSWWMFRVN